MSAPPRLSAWARFGCDLVVGGIFLGLLWLLIFALGRCGA